MKKLIHVLSFFLCVFNLYGQSLTTTFEKSGGSETTTYTDCIAFYQRLAKKYPKQIQIKTMGMTDAGYPLHLVVFNSASKFQPVSWKKENKLTILVNNGIHPGEPDGIDASMMLMRDAAEKKINIPQNVVLAVIPVYNIGGSLNRNSQSRVNQDGPASYGFRGNAQNLDLNRDFTKSDSRNAKAFAAVFHYIDPDILVDNHVSDGADYQYTMTLLTTQHNKLGYDIGSFLHDVFEPAIYKSMEQKKWPLIPYVNFYSADPGKGWSAFMDPPRFSSGYAALFQTMAFVPETHMLKPFKERVKSTYDLMRTMIDEGSRFAKEIKAKRKTSIEAMILQKIYALSWKTDSSKTDKIRFLGYESGKKQSEVTGMDRLYYDRNKPYSTQIDFYNYFTGEKMATKPKAYVIPQGWYEVIGLLKLNKVEMKRFAKDTMIAVETYRIEDYQTRQRPYEKHYPHYNTTVSSGKQQIQFLKGDYIIYTGQRADRFLVEMLEPTGDDSYFAWNFFDAILQQKEGYSEYRWEDVAAQYLRDHPELRAELEERKKTDKGLASASAQLEFVYKRSPYYEKEHLRYPVFRITGSAHSIPAYKGWINDFEGILSVEEERELESLVSDYETKTRVEIAVVTIDSMMTSYATFNEFVLHLHKSWGVGKKDMNNGIVIGISAGYRKIRITTGYGIEKVLSDAETKAIMDTEIIPQFKAGNYFEGLKNGIESLIATLDRKIKR